MPDPLAYQGFSHRDCPYFPCHPGVAREFNCLFCYCPLFGYQCPGTYRAYRDRHGQWRKDCTACHLPHAGYGPAWTWIQQWLEQPILWDGAAASADATRAAGGTVDTADTAIE